MGDILEDIYATKTGPMRYYPPTSRINLVDAVQQQVEVTFHSTHQFVDYYSTLQVLWPEIFEADKNAATKLAVAIYLEIAERKGFCIETENLKRSA